MNNRRSSNQRGRQMKRTQRRIHYETIIFEIKGSVATVTMNRPDKLNACNLKMFQEIDHALSLVEDNDDVKVVVITGAGDKAFSAGVDFEELDFKDIYELFGNAVSLYVLEEKEYYKMREEKKPIITEIDKGIQVA